MGLDPDVIGDIIDKTDLYFLPVVIVLGITGNIVAGVIFQVTDLKKISVVHYLIAMTITDSLYLFALFIKWLARFGITIYNSAGWCQFFYYILNAGQFLSIWNVMFVTADRFIVHSFPDRRRTFCTVIRAKIVVLAVSITAIVVFLNLSLTTGVHIYEGIGPICMVRLMFAASMQILEKFDIVLNKAVPFLGILLFNIVTCVKLCRPSTRSNRETSCFQERGQNDVTNRQRDVDVTLTMITMSSVALLLHLPPFVFRVRQMVALSKGQMEIMSISVMFQKAYYCNFAFKFYVYFSVSKIFRRALADILCCFCARTQDDVAFSGPIEQIETDEEVPMNGIKEESTEQAIVSQP